jgi:hypothetical protein
MESSKAPQNQTKVLVAVIMYMAFSSTMLIINKAAVAFFPLPSLLLVFQMSGMKIINNFHPKLEICYLNNHNIVFQNTFLTF